MLNPEEDTEWNDVLRSKGIIPAKKEAEVSEDTIVSMIEETIKQRTNDGQKNIDDMNLDELDELEDSEDEAILQEYRQKRIAEIQALAAKSRFGHVVEISGQDYVNEVNKAGEGIWVVLHLYEKGIPLCALLNQYMTQLAGKFPTTKFIKSIAKTCIPNFPEKNLPSIFIYYEGQLRKQIIGPVELRGTKLTIEEFEFLLGQYDAVPTEIKTDPKQSTIKDKMFSDLADTNDW